MDLNTVTEVVLARGRADLAGLGPHDAVLSGGTWLQSEPQIGLRRLVDLATLGWPALTLRERDDETGPAGLEIAATCTIAQLAAARLPAGWWAQPLVQQCCTAFLASFKVWNVATVGGNHCLSFPAGPTITLSAALDGWVTVWRPDGTDREQAVEDFVTGYATNTLAPGEVLRSVTLPARALRARTAYRKIALSPLGRSGIVLAGRHHRPADGGDDSFVLTVTAATVRPFVLRFGGIPTADELRRAQDDRIPADAWADDAHGAPDWRRGVTAVLAEEIRAELAAGSADGGAERGTT